MKEDIMNSLHSNPASIIENVQIKNASTKHNLRFLQYNPECQTLDLCTVNLSGSYIKNPIGNIRLHSVQRLIYTKPYKKEDIIRIIFYQGNELKFASISLQVFYTPQKLVSRLQSIGISFPTPLPPAQLGKYLANFFAQQMSFKTIAALPGWEHFPNPDDELHFLLPDTVPDEVLTSPLKDLEVNRAHNLTSEALNEMVFYWKSVNYPSELIALFIIRLNALLRTLLITNGRSFEFIVNLIPEKNTTEIQHKLQCILSLYKNVQTYRLPMSKAELGKIITEKRDDCIFFTVPHTKLNQYQRTLLSENLDNLLHLQQIYAFIPIVFSDGYLNIPNPEDMLSIPISNGVLAKINPQTLSALGNLSIEFVKFIDKNKNMLADVYVELPYDDEHAYDNIRNELMLTFDMFEKFLLVYFSSDHSAYVTQLGSICKKIAEFFNQLENSTPILGLSELFIEKLQKEIMKGTISLQDNSIVWNPETMAESVILTDGLHICMDAILFDNLVKQTFSHVLPLTVLQSLADNGYLIIDSSGRRHYKKRAKYTSPDHKIAFRRFVVLKQNLLNLPDGPRLI